VFRAVVLMGVLGWGVPMAVLFTLFHGTEDGENLLMRGATNLLIFGPLGAGCGLFMRKLMLHQQSAVASGADSGASRGTGSPAVLVVSTGRLVSFPVRRTVPKETDRPWYASAQRSGAALGRGCRAAAPGCRSEATRSSGRAARRSIRRDAH
jgi:hypothetical protein